MSAFRLDHFLDTERARVDGALHDVLAEGAGAVAEAARYAVEAGGKRLRPILCIAAWKAIGPSEVPAAAYRLAASLELIHAYSLIHDDLPSMDDDAVRRGRPATHVAYGVATATVAGVSLIPRAARVAVAACADLQLAPGVVTDLARVLFQAAGGAGMVGGQLLDLESEGRRITLPELERVHRLKTGALLAAAPVIGAIAAGATLGVRDAMTVYGRSLGLAFQIADDILDETGSSVVLGKTAGRDRELEKSTFPFLAGLEGARARALEEVEAAEAALDAAGVRSDELRALARYAVERDR